MRGNMYDNYIFDLYGTLVDIHTNESKASLWKYMAGYMALQGASYTGPELRKRYRALIGAQRLERHEKYVTQFPRLSPDEIEVDLSQVFFRTVQRKRNNLNPSNACRLGLNVSHSFFAASPPL